MINKLYIFSTKSENMATVLENLLFAANAKRPEQRGILSVRAGDPVLLFDIDKRALIGPFTAATSIYYSTEGPWTGRWDFLLNLEPGSIKVGVLSGRELLDLVLGKGTLSIRDISALETYWVHTLVLNEAREILAGFLASATYTRLVDLASQYGISSIRDARIGGKPLTSLIREEFLRGGRPPEWVIEAAVTLDLELVKKLAGIASEPVVANGIYLYMRKYLDISAFSPGGELAAIVEVKAPRDARSVESEIFKAIEQVSYYAYSVSRGLEIPIENITPAIAYYARSAHHLSKGRLKQEVEKAASTYGVREDRFTVLRIKDVTIIDEGAIVNYDVVY